MDSPISKRLRELAGHLADLPTILCNAADALDLAVAQENTKADAVGYSLVTEGSFLAPGEVAIRIIRDCQADEYKHFSGEAAQKLLHLQGVTPERDWQMILWHEATNGSA